MNHLAELQFNCIFQDFPACKLLSPQTIWISKEFPFDVSDINSEEEKRTIFANMFAYMIPGGVVFNNLKFDHGDSKTLRAERYGGAGIGDNGGGVRCGNLGQFQIKGIGKNPLVGSGKDLHHSYGGFQALYAIHEAIYTHLLEQIMPIGVVKIYGVILTGPDAAYKRDTERGWGGLFVRETALRPANFLRAGHYVPSNPIATSMPSDVARVRMANKELMKRFVDANGFIQFLNQFVKNCANQFAFARIARIMHGAATPSNICFDGRWLDLTNTGFLSSAENNAGGNRTSPSFFEEMEAPVGILREVVATFNKYNNAEINVASFISYYREQLKVYLKCHLSYLFAITYENIGQNLLNSELEYLKFEVLKILSAGKVIYDKWPSSLPDDDPILCLVEGLFLSTKDKTQGIRQLLGTKSITIWNVDKLLHAFLTVFDSVFAARKNSSINYQRFVIGSFITSFKRAALPEYFYKGRLEATIIKILGTGDLKTIRRLIESSIALSEWAFSGAKDDMLVLFDSPDLCMSYDCVNGCFDVHETHTQQNKTFYLPSDLWRYIDSQEENIFLLNEYSFKKYLNRVLNTVELLVKSRGVSNAEL